jgi:hypothetical protein
MAPVPRGLRCRDQIVWVNMSSRAYHEEGDPYYGRTRNGEYMCMGAANARGYHLAGAHGTMTNERSSSGNSYGRTRGHRGRSTYAPEPGSTP